MLCCVALTLVTALHLNGETPPRDLTQKVPGLKAVGGRILSCQLLKSPPNTGSLLFLYNLSITLSYLLTLNQRLGTIETAASYFSAVLSWLDLAMAESCCCL